MQPGKIVAKNSQITTDFYQSTESLLLVSGGSYRFLLYTYDKYNNKIANDIWAEELNVTIELLTRGPDYAVKTKKLSLSNYEIEIKINKTGQYNDWVFSFGNYTTDGNGVITSFDLEKFVNFTYKATKKFNAPDSVIIVPGKCSKLYPEVDIANIKDGFLVGKTYTFGFRCRDFNNNPLVLGGDASKFTVIINGVGLDKVKNDDVRNVIKDNNDGSYTVRFITGWVGKYTFFVLLNGEPYSTIIESDARISECTDPLNPLKCPNSNKDNLICKAKYTDCGLANMCDDTEKPFLCKVDGVEGCQKSKMDCDCAAGLTKCPTDKKCVSDATLCGYLSDKACPNEYPFKCQDGRCRVNADACASKVVCPPGFTMCPDESCVNELTGTCQTFTACPSDAPYKCEEQSCVKSPELCPTRITCALASQVVCPDLKCAYNELQCSSPEACEEGLVKCSDNSCRTSFADCPKKTTCPEGKALCPDSTCLNTCEKNFRRRLLRRLQSKNNNDVDTVNVVCPGGEIVSSVYLCPSLDTCPEGTVRCGDGSCQENLKQCIAETCNENEFLCWDGKCETNPEKCATRSICPASRPTKCVDGSCAISVSECKDYVPCPFETPYKCASGECRRTSKECPTLTICPNDFPILCNDGSCKKAPYACELIAEKKFCKENEALCPDGSCALSKSMCPTIPSCATDQVKCADNRCVKNINECQSLNPDIIICPLNLPLRCPDGSCRANYNDCPTQLICPTKTPIKCDDGNCVQSVSQCYNKTDCGYGLTRCPDGTCSSTGCGTPVTCSKEEPYKCWDSTCRADPRDCPAMKICTGETPILCPDGRCASTRYMCTVLDKCPLNLPVRCPDFNCYKSRDECLAIKGCPIGKLKCETGECVSTIEECRDNECPLHLPFKCYDGFCVADKKFCNVINSGCPSVKPFKCKNGACAKEEKSCLNENQDILCPNGQKTCPDGSCMTKCPNAFGCTLRTEIRCSDGTCRDTSVYGECPVARCPKDAPIKCLSGLCVTSVNNCPSILTEADYKVCSEENDGNNIPCADGLCVSSSEQCKPLYNCPLNFARCKDGSCRILSNTCPVAEFTCPISKPWRCESGACAENQKACPTTNGCTYSNPFKCPDSGECVTGEKECKTIINANGCPISKPYLCQDGSCVKDLDKNCKENVCPSNLPFACLDGTCASTSDECLKRNSGCKDDSVICPDGTCKQSEDLCRTVQGCPVDTPFKCGDGSCKALPYSLDNSTLGCTAAVKCPKYKPYLCADGECQGDPALCRAQMPCPDSTPFRCADKSCAISATQCPLVKICPVSSPILCDGGFCVTTVTECLAVKVVKCPSDKPFSCANGKCVEKHLDCLINDGHASNTKIRRILQGSTSSDHDCKDELKARCSDGSCRQNYDQCPLYPGCTNPSKPYKCGDGSCADRASSCPASPQCGTNKTLCVDGFCRNNCTEIPFNGCPNEKPLKCGNGFCAKTLADCAGESDCPTNKPFRCLDNTCVQKIEFCPFTVRNRISEAFVVSLAPESSKTLDFINDENTLIKYASLVIPSGALLSPLDSLNKQKTTGKAGLEVSSVPRSKVEKYVNLLNRTEDTLTPKLFPIADFKLGYYQSVRSTILKFKSLNRVNLNEDYRFPLVLEIAIDPIKDLDAYNNYCLAKVDDTNNEWNCMSRKVLKYDSLSNKITFAVPSDGIYAVIYNPRPKLNVITEKICSFYCQHKKAILVTLVVATISFVLFSYVFWRIYRYIDK